MPYYRLPVPEIREENSLEHSYKQQTNRRLRPPKLKTRYYHHDSNFNRSHSSFVTSNTAHSISFRGESTCGEPNTKPLDSSEHSYFDSSFSCLAKIGEGSFGEVFKVRCKEDGLLYAVKMSKQLFRSEHYRQERLEEVRRYEEFSENANCVRFYRAWEQDDRLYMQMELCRESLESMLERQGRLPEEKIWSILLDLLLALKSLHDKNLIHLDIKLDNVLIGDDESCKLADFGLVIDVDRANRHQATEGDSRYIAPEIMQGKFSKAVDIFSLGIAMLELSCYLELPSNGPLWQQLRSGILPQNFIQTISPELLHIIKHMMTPDPLDRPTVDQLLEHKRFLGMMQRRRRWHMLKKVKNSFRKAKRLTWAKVCNLKNVIVHFLSYCLYSINMLRNSEENKKPISPKSVYNSIKIISSTPSSSETSATEATTILPNGFQRPTQNLIVNEPFFEIRHPETNSSTPLHFPNFGKAVNSTPVNHQQHNSFRSRKDLTKVSFNINYEELLNDDEHSANLNQMLDASPSNCTPKSLYTLEGFEPQQQSFMRKHADASLKGKKLFADSD